jgi:citrate synthase
MITPEQHNELIQVLWDTHKEAAMRDNSSKMILEIAWDSNGNNLRESIIAALCSFGGRHAPIKMTYSFLQAYIKLTPESRNGFIANLIRNKDVSHGNIPGLGSSFVKGQHDPMLNGIKNAIDYIDPVFSEIAADMMQRVYGAKGVSVFPNLAFYTAAAMLLANVPPSMCEYIAIGARTEAWMEHLFTKAEQ